MSKKKTKTKQKKSNTQKIWVISYKGEYDTKRRYFVDVGKLDLSRYSYSHYRNVKVHQVDAGKSVKFKVEIV